MFRRWLKRLLCKHEDQLFVRNLHGDQIIQAGYKRSEFRCAKCGALVFGDALHITTAHVDEGLRDG